MHPPRSDRRRAVTLLELIIALVLVIILSAAGVPHVRHVADAIATRGAAADAAEMLESARQLALARWTRTTVTIDTAAGILTLVIGPDTVLRRDERSAHGTRLRATRLSTVYTPLGLALGVSNLTLVATRGAAAETVTVSRLGRVRR